MKKSICAIGLGMILLGGLAGCGWGAGSEDAVTVTVWTANYHDKTFVEQNVNEWNSTIGREEHIYIDYQVKDDVVVALEQAFAAGEAPDLFPILGNKLENYVQEERIAAIEDMPGGRELVAGYEGLLAPYKHTYDGKTYILPNSAITYGLVYNKEMFEEAGLVDENGEAKPPETLAELREYAKILTNPDKNEYGIIFPGKYSDWFSDDVLKPASASTRCFGYDPVTGFYDYGSLVPMMETILGIKEDGSCVPGTEKIDNDPARARFAEGGIGMYFSASYDYSVFTNQYPAKIEWGVAPYPVEDPETARKQFSGYNGYLAINKESTKVKDPEALMKVYQWFYSDEIAVRAYEEGINLPTDMALVEDVNLDGEKRQWQEYAALLEVSAPTPMQMPFDIDERPTPQEIWTEYIWTGKISVEELPEVCDKISEMMNEGVLRYQRENPDFDPSPFILPAWEGTSKR